MPLERPAVALTVPFAVRASVRCLAPTLYVAVYIPVHSVLTQTKKTHCRFQRQKNEGIHAQCRQADISEKVRQVATDLVHAQEEFGNLRKREKISKQPILEEQKAVED